MRILKTKEFEDLKCWQGSGALTNTLWKIRKIIDDLIRYLKKIGFLAGSTCKLANGQTGRFV